MVDAAMNDLMRPALYDAYHHIEAVETKDIGASNGQYRRPDLRNRRLPPAKTAPSPAKKGTYCLSAVPVRMVQAWRTTTHTRNRAAEVLVDGSGYKLSANVKPSSSKWPTNWLVCRV